MELSEADSFDGPEIDSSLDGVFAGVGWEIVRHPRVVPLDFRVGVDYLVLEDDRTFVWAALGLTFY
jgi:hypothetical protein